MTEPNMSNVERAIRQFRALVKLEQNSMTKTTRARNELLRSLNDADLILVAEALESEYGNLISK